MGEALLKKSVKHINQSVLVPLLKWIYPSYCILCESSEIDGLNQVCFPCWNQLPRAAGTSIRNITIAREKDHLIFISEIHSFFDFSEGIQGIIHEMKYNGRTRIARELIQFLEDDIKTIFDHSQQVDMIIPVPLHSKRENERGYNQGELLTTEISRILDKPNRTNAVIRNKNTKSQTKLSARDRIKNMNGAFSMAFEEIVKDKVVLLVDDIITTGSTLNECAKVLIEGKAKRVVALTMARA